MDHCEGVRGWKHEHGMIKTTIIMQVRQADFNSLLSSLHPHSQLNHFVEDPTTKALGKFP